MPPQPQPSIQDLPSIHPPMPERCAPSVFVNADGEVIPDPWALLGLSRGATHDQIRDAWAEQTRLTPPESDGERARLLREARDRLTLPERLLERVFGVLTPPSPKAWGLPEAPAVVSDTKPAILEGRVRLLAQSIAYVLVEEALAQPDE